MGKPSRILALDGLRAIAASLVFLEHFVLVGHGLGWVGVYFFFVLSGFLIVGILHKQRLKIEANGLSGISKEFYIFWEKRIRRIFPLYYLALLLVLTLQVGVFHFEGLWANGFSYYFFMLGNYYVQYVAHHWSWFSHLWSISTEQQFYMMASPLLLLIPSRFHTRLFVALLLFSIGFICADLLHSNGVNTPYIPSQSLFVFMAGGGLVALNAGKTRKRRFVDSGAAVLGILSTLVIVIWWKAPVTWDPSWIASFWLSILIAGVGSIRYLTCYQTSLAVKFLELPPLRYLGTISYGFYVYHYFMPVVLELIPGHGLLQRYPHTFYPLVLFAMSVLTASVSWEFFEKRILHKGRV